MNSFVVFYLLVLKLVLSFEDGADSTSSIHEIPHMISGNISLTSFVGDTVTLPCEIANLGSHHVNWIRFRNKTPLTLTVGYHQFSRNMRYRVARIHKSTNKNKIESWNFEIRKVTADDQGIYQCNIKPNIKAYVELIVKPESEKSSNDKTSPSFFSDNYVLDNPRSERLSSSSLEKIDMPPNSWVKLRCNATGIIQLSLNKADSLGRSNYDLQWYKDGRLIEQDSRRLKKWVSSYDNSNYMELELYAVEADDSGVYQCKRDKTVLKNVVLNILENKSLSLKAVNLFIYLLISLMVAKTSF